MRLRRSNWLIAALIIIALGASAELSLISPASADEVQIQGIGQIKYESGIFSGKPDTASRNQALELAKRNALERYTAGFSTSKFQLYQNVESQVLANLSAYIPDALVIDEGYNKNAKQYYVTVRATINETRLDALINSASSGPTASQQPSRKISISFLFVARETSSVRQFEDRVTQVSNNQAATSATQRESLSGGRGSYQSSTEQANVSTTGGSTLRKADTLTYSVTSPENMNATMNDVFSSNGFEVYDYRDVKEKCGGVDPNAIYKMFANAGRTFLQDSFGSVQCCAKMRSKQFCNRHAGRRIAGH